MGVKNVPKRVVAPDVTDTDEILGQVAVEFFERRAHGEVPSIEEYAQQYPQIAEHIRRTFPALELVGDSAAASNIAVGEPMECANHRLGDYQIICEIGRGGMGVVYEAEQLSIGRRVALKVLPFAALVDNRALQRFKNEVRAAATLDHPNIVTVHSVGEERGIHYYAMQLIRGQSLAEVIHELRRIRPRSANVREPSASASPVPDETPSPTLPQTSRGATLETRTLAKGTTSVPSKSGQGFYRKVAELGAQAAQALHYAHEQGIIHRDIKPANLMLDDAGKMYVTDFGLARIESDAGVTMTGDLVGTLRYMAPEQALANRITVDHRADIYSLGATLYEFATLQPIFQGSDREHLLRQVAFELPLAPSKVVRDFPRDLETIICKSLGKDPDERYASASDVADDLRRFLDHKPILGKRPTSFQTITKWMRRNPAVSVTTVIALLMTIAGLSFAFVRATAEAEQQRRSAYPGSLTTAYSEYADGHMDAVGTILQHTRPTGRQTDLRGFEWHLLHELHRQFQEEKRIRFPGTVREVAYSQDGRWLAALTRRGELSVVDLGRQENNRTVLTPGGEILKRKMQLCLFAFSPDGRYLYSAFAREESPLRRFDLYAKPIIAETFTDARVQPSCLSVAVAQDGTIATVGRDTDNEWLCVVWEPSTGKPRVSAPCNNGYTVLKWSPDGKRLVTGGWHTLQIWEAAQLSVIYESLANNTFAAEFSPDSQLLVCGGQRGIRILDVTKDPIELRSEPGTDDEIWDLTFLDTDRFVTGARSGQVTIWDARNDARLAQFKRELPIRSIAYSPARQELAIGGAPEVSLISDPEAPIPRVHATYMHNVGVVPSAAALVTSEDALVLWSPRTGKPVPIANVWDDLPDAMKKEFRHDYIMDVGWSSDKRTVAVVHRFDRSGGKLSPMVTLWNADGDFLARIDAGGYVAFTPQENHLVAANGQEQVLELWDWQAGQRIAPSPVVPLPDVGAMRFSPNGRYLATGHGNIQEEGDVHVWEVRHDQIRLHRRFPRFDRVEDLAFTPDEEWVAAGDVTGVILHHVDTEETKRISTGHVHSLDISSDGRRLVTTEGNRIRFWDLNTLNPLGTLEFGSMVTTVRFLDDEQLLYIVKGAGANILDTRPKPSG